MEQYTFVKSGNNWYIDLPAFIEQGGSMGDLQMVDGADTMLDMMAGHDDSVVLSISQTPFEGADVLILTERCDPNIGGGYYRMEKFEEEMINRTMWLCQVTEFVFGALPDKIFVKRAASHSV